MSEEEGENYNIQEPNLEKVEDHERPFGCELCQKRFKTRIHLKRHMLTHPSEKPFQCDQCEYKAQYDYSLRYHILLVHAYKAKITISKPRNNNVVFVNPKPALPTTVTTSPPTSKKPRLEIVKPQTPVVSPVIVKAQGAPKPAALVTSRGQAVKVVNQQPRPKTRIVKIVTDPRLKTQNTLRFVINPSKPGKIINPETQNTQLLTINQSKPPPQNTQLLATNQSKQGKLIKPKTVLRKPLFKCKLCESFFVNQELLDKHAEKHVGHRKKYSQFCCHNCSNKPTFQSQEEMDEHVLTHHGKLNKVYHCDECDYQGRHEEGLRSHKLYVHDYKAKFTVRKVQQSNIVFIRPMSSATTDVPNS